MVNHNKVLHISLNYIYIFFRLHLYVTLWSDLIIIITRCTNHPSIMENKYSASCLCLLNGSYFIIVLVFWSICVRKMVDNHLWAGSLPISRTSSRCWTTSRGAFARPMDRHLHQPQRLQPHQVPLLHLLRHLHYFPADCNDKGRCNLIHFLSSSRCVKCRRTDTIRSNGNHGG